MTIEAFRKYIKKNRLNNLISRLNYLINYLICLVFKLAGIYLLFITLYDGFNTNNLTGIYIPIIGPIFLCFIGSYGFWRIPRDYEVTSIFSVKKTDEKWNIINDYLSQLKIESRSLTIGVVECRYKNKFFNRVDLTIYVDDEKFLFNAHGVDFGSGGFIDFGLTGRSKRKLKKYIQSCL